MSRAIEVFFNVNYITETLVDLCNRFKHPDASAWLESQIDHLVPPIIDSCIMDLSTITSSSMFESYNDDIFKNGVYIIIESLVKDYKVPFDLSSQVTHELISATREYFHEMGIIPDKIGRYEQFNSSLHLWVHR
jgi:hypothetical protein